MAKEKSAAKLAKAERRSARKAQKEEAKAAKVERNAVKKAKSDKKEKKEKRKVLAEKALNELDGESKATKDDKRLEESEDDEENDEGVEVEVNDEGVNGAGHQDEDDEADEDDKVEEDTMVARAAEEKMPTKRLVGALVPFANPLADDKVAKKVFKTVKKAAAQRTLKRGVKEVVKALRKSPGGTPHASDSLPLGVVVLAADISPMDVISHIPVLAEDHDIPYIYVTSRAELGMAGQTKRPTSVVMVARDEGKKSAKNGKDKEDEGEAWEETYKSLVKVVEREGRHVKI